MVKIGKRYILLAVFILICAYMAQSIYNGVTQSTVDQVDNQQMIHATQAAGSIESFFERYNYSLNYLAHDEHIIAMDEMGRQNMETFYNSNSLEIQGITRVDASGHIVYTVPYNNSAIGSDISSQSHVKEIIQTHEPVTSDVFTTVQGTRSIAFHIPVFKDNQFDGTLAVLIPFDNLTRDNLEDIQIMGGGTAWVTSQNGTILYAHNATAIGRNAEEAFGGSASLGEMLAGMERGESGRAVYEITYDNGSTARMHAIYMPAHLPDKYWSIAISTPESDIMSVMEGFRNNLIIILGTTVLGTLIFFYYSIRAWAIISEEGRRKEAENALRKNEELLRKVLDTLTVGVWIVDSKGVVKSGNPASRKVWGGAREAGIEELGKVRGWWADTGKPVATSEWAAARAMRKGETSINEAIDIECLDGTRKTILNSAAPILGDDGKIEGAIIVNHDITEQRKTQMALLESEHKFRAFAETASSGIMIYQEGKLTYVNPAVQRLTNYTEEAIFAMGEWDYIHPDYREVVKSTIGGNSPTQAGCEAMMQTGNDRKVWVHVNGRQMMLDGKPATVITIFDITARKMADDQIKASLAEKEVLLKEIHHRVKNNLQIISSLLNLQSSYIVDDRDREMFQDSQNRVRSMALIHEKLYQSRDLGRINFHDYLLDLVNSLYRSYNARPGQITLSIDVGDMYLSIDRGIPCGLITNELVSNCLKHAFPGDRNGSISITMSQSTDYFELVVSDDGIGLPQGFDMEKQGSLGMQLINTLVEQLEGEIKIETGKGTTFTIQFPGKDN